MNISTILDQIDLGRLKLPEFQRGYVWNREQVRGLMRSLYRGYPIGGLLVWQTARGNVKTRGDSVPSSDCDTLLLDGQQRVSTLYGIIRGKLPPFFEGDPQAFTGLHFNVECETFEFHAPAKMKGDPTWIDVTELMRVGAVEAANPLFQSPAAWAKAKTHLSRLNRLDQITKIDLHVEQVGTDKSLDEVVDIFNQVNSGGTKLSKGDLALARVCVGWPGAREELRACLGRWERAGYEFELDWLLRNINTVITGEANFSALADVTPDSFQKGLKDAAKAIDFLLNVVSGRLGLDHDRVLGGRYAFPVMARFLTPRGGHFLNARERDQLLYWYVHTFLWGRYAGATETTLNQDLALADARPDSAQRLIEQLRRWRGTLTVRPDDFEAWSVGARFYPLLYLLTRVGGAQDWCSGVPLSAHMLGKLASLELHHIFPRALLYSKGYSRSEVNALANYCFLTKECHTLCHSEMGHRSPESHLGEVQRRFPGALASQWVPMDRELWKVERYREFLAARRELLAKAANSFLDRLLSGSVPEVPIPTAVSVPEAVSSVPESVESDEEWRQLQEVSDWVAGRGLPRGTFGFELIDSESGRPPALVDLAWPNGLQQGLSQPVALILGEGDDVEDALNRAGYRYFTDVPSFRKYVEREILALELAGA